MAWPSNSCAPMASAIIVRRSRRMPSGFGRWNRPLAGRPCCWSPRTCAAFCRKLLDRPMGPVLKVLSSAISSTGSSWTLWAARWSGRSVEAEAESEAFGKDLAIYARWRERNATLSAKSLRSANDAPFPDRCAILLDPAMMEQARRAAALFQTDLLRIGARIFGRLGRQVSRRSESSGAQARSASVRARKGAASTPAKRPRTGRKPINRAKPPRRRR